MNNRHDDELKKSRSALLAFLFFALVLAVAGTMEYQDDQSRIEHMCQMIADGDWPKEVDVDGVCK